MKPIYWTFHANRWLEEAGHLRFRRRSLQPLKGGELTALSKADQRLARTTRPYGRALDLVPFLPVHDPTVPSPTSTSARRAPTASPPAARSSSARRAERVQIPASPSGSPPSWPRSATPSPERQPSTCAQEGRALPRPAPRQGTGDRDPAARRAHPRGLLAPGLAGRVRTPRTPRSRALLRLLGPPRADGNSRRGRARHSTRPRCLAGARSRSFPRRFSACSVSVRTAWTERRSSRSSPTREARSPSPRRSRRTVAPQSVYSDAEEEDMIERLRDLGYE